MGRTYLNVPFAEKDSALARGARWDPQVKRWYVPEHIALQPFSRWHAEAVPDDASLMVAPIMLLEATSTCWKCRRRSPVFCLACRDVREAGDDRLGDLADDGLVLISDLAALDGRIQQHLHELASAYRPDWSGTKGSRCWMNHCRDCSAKMGDFYLHCEPDGPFFAPTQVAWDWNHISRYLLEREGEYYFDGAYSL